MRLAMLAAALLGLFPLHARADKVKLEVKVVEASTNGTAIDPKLKHMEADFKHKGFAYSSYKLVSDQTPVLDVGQSADIALPNGKSLKLTAKGVANTPPLPANPAKKLINMHVTIPQLVDLDYSVGNRGTYFLGAGPLGHGSPNESQVFLVIQHTAQ